MGGKKKELNDGKEKKKVGENRKTYERIIRK